MIFSKKKKDAQILNNNSGKEKAAAKIAGFILSLQKRFAVYMGKKTERLSIRSKKISLFLFCILSGGYSVLTIGEALFGLKRKHPSLTPAQVTVPKYYNKTGSDEAAPMVTATDKMMIKRFKTYMDSLKSSPGGRPVYDSILRARPGLTDSITFFEQLSNPK